MLQDYKLALRMLLLAGILSRAMTLMGSGMLAACLLACIGPARRS